MKIVLLKRCITYCMTARLLNRKQNHYFLSLSSLALEEEQPQQSMVLAIMYGVLFVAFLIGVIIFIIILRKLKEWVHSYHYQRSNKLVYKTWFQGKSEEIARSRNCKSSCCHPVYQKDRRWKVAQWGRSWWTTGKTILKIRIILSPKAFTWMIFYPYLPISETFSCW